MHRKLCCVSILLVPMGGRRLGLRLVVHLEVIPTGFESSTSGCRGSQELDSVVG